MFRMKNSYDQELEVRVNDIYNCSLLTKIERLIRSLKIYKMKVHKYLFIHQEDLIKKLSRNVRSEHIPLIESIPEPQNHVSD